MGYKNSLKNTLKVLGSSGKVLEFKVSNIAGTLNSAVGRFVHAQMLGQPANPGSPGNWPLKWNVCVCVCVVLAV